MAAAKTEKDLNASAAKRDKGDRMDRLALVFQMQRELDEFISKSRGLDFGPEAWIQKQVLAMVAELGELLDEVNYKWWKAPRPLDMQAVREELVDVFHFLIGACIKAGMGPDELFTAYCQKNKENWDRQRGKAGKEGYAVASLRASPCREAGETDIDGPPKE